MKFIDAFLQRHGLALDRIYVARMICSIFTWQGASRLSGSNYPQGAGRMASVARWDDNFVRLYQHVASMDPELAAQIREPYEKTRAGRLITEEVWPTRTPGTYPPGTQFQKWVNEVATNKSTYGAKVVQASAV